MPGIDSRFLYLSYIPGAKPAGGFAQCLKGKKWSYIYRRLNRSNIDQSMARPPSYFTRRREGIPVPSLDRFMRGYTNILKMKLSSKTLENSFLVMNRQVWTNQKQHLSTVQRGPDEEQASDKCVHCEQIENTLHLLFECEKYAEPLWQLLKQGINAMLQESTGRNNVVLHAYNVMYNEKIAGLTGTFADKIHILIQEIKRNIVFRRCQRQIQNRNVRIDWHRIRCHLVICMQRLIKLREFQGKSSVHLENLIDKIGMAQ
jgi:hypothetical protein